MAYQMSEESKQRKREYNRRWERANRAKRREQANKRYAENLEQHRAYALKSYYKHIEENRRKQRERKRIIYRQDKARVYAQSYKSHCKIREEVLTHYGNGQLACLECGESRLACLSIDHISGNGADHRKTLPKYQRSGVAFYRWLKKQRYPQGYQTLCMNCQWVKRAENKEYGVNPLRAVRK